MVRHIWKIILIPIWLMGTAGFGLTLLEVFRHIEPFEMPYRPIFIGAIIITLTYFLLRRSIYFRWLQTFTHELTHALFGLLAFNKIKSFKVFLRPNADGALGAVKQEGTGHFIIVLTPYCFPILTYFLIIFRPFLSGELLFTFDLILGATYAFHLLTFLQDMGPHQTDFTRCGILFSYLFVFFMNFLLIGIFLTYIGGGLEAVSSFCQAGFYQGLEVGRDFINFFLQIFQ